MPADLATYEKWANALARMALNTACDLAIGTIPIVGDVFDVAFKSHRKNVDILSREVSRLDTLPMGAPSV
ncbi:DUF4112 domain-containing protein [Yoonia sp. R2331]|uniref:DUF4112 domain-containing protein n=1 Tax=Yoonia sp. R2331 TaxID=3237238 RepID=UPI0034E40FA9